MPSHVVSLDGFRGLAALAVVSFHFMSHRGLGPLGYALSFGWTGVDGFLVLSGFLITGILYRDRGSPHYFRNFYIRRALRLFPLYYLIVLLAVGVSFFAGHPWRLGHIGFLLYGANFALSHDQSLGDLGIFNMRHFWTLALEEQFYLLWPWIVGSSLSRKALQRICAIGITCAIVCRFALFFNHVSTWVIYYSLPTRMDSLLIGATISLIPLPGKAVARWVLGASALLYVGLVLLGRNSYYSSPPILLVGYTVLAMLYGALLVLAIHPSTIASKTLSTAPMRFLGRLSYGIYLWHYLFSVQVEELKQRIDQVVHPALAASIVGFMIPAALSVLLAWFSYNVVERPFLKLKGRFSAKRRAADNLSLIDAAR